MFSSFGNKKYLSSLKVYCIKYYLVLQLVIVVISPISGFDISPEIPSHLPSPPAAPASVTTVPAASRASMSGADNVGGFSGGSPPLPAVQNVPVGSFGPGPGPLGPSGGPSPLIPFGGPLGGPFGGPFGGPPFGPIPPDAFVPFGLNHIILIMIPQFKSKFRKFPGWLESTIKISMPITVFFDKLDLGPEFPMPPPGGLPPPGLRPPFPFAGGISGTAATGGGYPYGAYPYANDDEDDDDEKDSESSDEPDGDTNETYENDHDSDSYYSEEDRALRKRKRRKRSLLTTGDQSNSPSPCSKSNGFQFKSSRTNKIKKRSVPFNRTIHAAERASLFPKLESILDTNGLGGKSCLLRAICEVHEAPLDHYGLLGEMFTMFFSVSRSIFADSHLPEYLQAELSGKKGDCSEFHRHCDKTLFSWEEQLVSVNSL